MTATVERYMSPRAKAVSGRAVRRIDSMRLFVVPALTAAITSGTGDGLSTLGADHKATSPVLRARRRRLEPGPHLVEVFYGVRHGCESTAMRKRPRAGEKAKAVNSGCGHELASFRALLLCALLLTGCGTKVGYFLACGPNGEKWPEPYCQAGPPGASPSLKGEGR
jgi:hypothetical protein